MWALVDPFFKKSLKNVDISNAAEFEVELYINLEVPKLFRPAVS